MRIMEIVSGTAVNGALVTCLEVTKALAERGHSITLVCRPDSWIAGELKDTDVEIVYSSLKRWPPQELRRIANEARQRDIDVFHTHMSSANFFGIILRRMTGIPCVATANNRYIQLHWMFNDFVVAASDATRKFHQRYNLVPRRKIDVVYNFIEDSRFQGVSESARNTIREQWELPQDALAVGAIGDVIQRKGLVHLVRAMPRLLEQVPHAHIISIGHTRCTYVREVKAEISKLGVENHFTWAGRRNDMPEVLSALDACVLPTLEDNLPLAILEAMASGLPVVASRVGGLPECVLENETGFLVPPADHDRLADALIRLLSESSMRLKFGENARQKVRDTFSRDSQVARMESFLQRFAA